MLQPIRLGAVIYDPKVTVIWGIIRDFFEQNGCPLDVFFYANYQLQVDAFCSRSIDVAWNSPLAWLDTERLMPGKVRAIAMRDTDRDRITHLVVRKSGPIKTVADLRGRVVAVGASDSPQATLIPIEMLRKSGLTSNQDVMARRFDVLVGLHGDHIGGELDAFKCLQRGDAAASAMLDLNWERWTKDGTINGQEYSVLASTDPFDHCNFTVADDFDADREKAFLRVLFSMDYENPKHKEMMDMEGLKEWLPGRTSGYGPLQQAVDAQSYFASAR